jgi:glycosyltransferase involved in cell wall biosynthesis
VHGHLASAHYTRPGLKRAGPQPALSVLIASHNRRGLLRRCLDSLGAQTQDPGAFEVIVADDGSTDGTADLVEGLDTAFALRVLRLAQAGKYAAINAAIEAARGPVCVIFDDDVIASPELVGAHLAAHREDARTLGIGALTQQPPPGRDWYAQAFARGWNEHFEERGDRPADWTDCYGANFSAPRSALIECGGFATDLTVAGDLEIGFRLQRVGCVPRYLPAAHGVHDDRKGYRRMLDDARRQGAAHVELAARHPAAAHRLLDWPSTAGANELRVRRLLIALRVPPAPLVTLGALVPGAGRRMVWFHAVRRFAFWRSARRSMDRRQWARVTRERRDGSGDGLFVQRAR